MKQILYLLIGVLFGIGFYFDAVAIDNWEHDIKLGTCYDEHNNKMIGIECEEKIYRNEKSLFLSKLLAFPLMLGMFFFVMLGALGLLFSIHK